jgi:hypothetical protein
MLHSHVVGYEILDLSLGPGVAEWTGARKRGDPMALLDDAGRSVILEPISAAGRYMYVSGILC